MGVVFLECEYRCIVIKNVNLIKGILSLCRRGYALIINCIYYGDTRTAYCVYLEVKNVVVLLNYLSNFERLMPGEACDGVEMCVPINLSLVGMIKTITHTQPLRSLLFSVGGTSVVLGLVAMATTVDSLYASMKALVCIVGNNPVALREMERTGGFQVRYLETALLRSKGKPIIY